MIKNFSMIKVKLKKKVYNYNAKNKITINLYLEN